ncbi:MAG: S46 family peptidase, partial [Bacteroidales bacterium]|nr:S46 family peptidase [Bacteroidales bacterium]
MKKVVLSLMMALFAFGQFAKADEGMWLPFMIDRLNHTDMQKMGLNLTAEEIYSVNNSSLKDAIVIFGGGCTGEMISDQGLLLTNHHCGYGQIQAHSTVDHDYLTDGFWAYSKEEELSNPGLTVKYLVRIEDVTEQIVKELSDTLSENERSEAAYNLGKSISDKATEGTHYDANVKSFFSNNEYYLFVYETFRDIRLVGAPPSSIGKFGADTDNWMWPRHTDDFSMFRVYCGPDGKPADYSKDNVPYKPKHHLPINIAGIEKGDYAMIMGNPGSTDRYLTSFGVDQGIELNNPTIVDIREEKLRIMREDMDASPKVRIQYASKYARTANYWKYFIGQTKGLKRLKVADQKRELEAQLDSWINADEARKAEYGTILNDMKESYDGKGASLLSNIYFMEAIYRGSEVLGHAYKYKSLAKAIEEENTEKVEKLIAKHQAGLEEFYKDYNAATDVKLLGSMLEMFYENVPAYQHPEFLTKINKKYKGDFNKYAEKLFAKTAFANQANEEAFLANPKAKTILKDPAFQIIDAFIQNYITIQGGAAPYNEQFDKADRLFVKALREMLPNKKFYPNANFTMRVTYGQVLDYYPSDAVHFNYYTTLAGVMEKEDPNNWEFVVHDKLKEIYKNKDYGQYGEGDVMKTCFLTNHDITGGNSGSPVINADGHLIGLAFDGNWEAMSGDIAFEPKLQRTINADIRYVL